MFFKAFTLFSLISISFMVGLSKQERNKRFDTRIVGGAVVQNRTLFAYQVSLRVQGEHYCGGTIYKDNYVITAAHCAKGLDREQIEVVAGDLNLLQSTPNTQRSRVHRIRIHEQYDKSNNNDIAILHLKQKFRINNFVRSIPIYNASISHKGFENCRVSGWGSLRTDGPITNNLRQVDVKVFNSNLCEKRLGKSFKSRKMLCAGDLVVSKDACQGDSGGPLACNGALYGVVSWGYKCGDPAYPGVYTNASYYNEWIKRTVNHQSNIRSTFLTSCILILFVMFL